MSERISWPMVLGPGLTGKFYAIQFFESNRPSGDGNPSTRRYRYAANLRINPKPGPPKWDPIPFNPFEQ